jgi:uncharacterized OB-fold protein
MPRPSELSEPHWAGARAHRLMVQQCRNCAIYNFPPRPVCPRCFSTELDWKQSSGRGTIYSYTVIHRAPDPSFDPPYCAAIITLEEGWSMISNVIGTPMDELAVGLPVHVEFVPFGELTLPMFKLEISKDGNGG